MLVIHAWPPFREDPGWCHRCARAGPDSAGALPPPFSIVFVNSCRTLAQASTASGMWEELTSLWRRASHALGQLQGGLRQLRDQSQVVQKFSKSWTFYFFFAEFFLVLTFICGGMAVWKECAHQHS